MESVENILVALGIFFQFQTYSIQIIINVEARRRSSALLNNTASGSVRMKTLKLLPDAD